MTRADLATAHQRACDALDLARDHLADDTVRDQLRRATIHLWYALNSSDDQHERLAAAERHLTAALDDVDDDISRTLQTVLDHLGQRSGGVA